MPGILLVPVDGSKNADRAVKAALDLARESGDAMHLINVQPPVSAVVATFIGKGDLAAYHREEGEKALASAKALCAKAGVEPVVHIGVGRAGEVVAAFAKKLKARMIVMGTRGHTGLSGVILGSVAQDVLARASVPVHLVK
jgi:nucleotide-binding universal stress UspA family protein